MVVSTTKKKATTRARTAKNPSSAAGKLQGTFKVRDGEEIFMNENWTPGQLRTFLSKIPVLMAKNGPGRYTIEIVARHATGSTTNGAARSTTRAR